MKAFSSIASCRICESDELIPVLSLGTQYLTGVFPRSADEKLTRGPLELVKCSGGPETCGLLQLKHSYDSAELYGDSYGYRSSLNRSMLDHLAAKVEHLRRVVSVDPGDMVVDIGSNDGSALSFYPESLVRVGIDPTAQKFRSFYKPGIHVLPEFFSAGLLDAEFGGAKAKIVTSIAMFYDLERPLDFVREVESILDDDGIWHFEQSYMPLMLDTNGYDTVCHEHVEYYALAQIEWMIRRSGLRILDVELNSVNGGSFGVTVCRESSSLEGDETQVEEIRQSEKERGFDSMRPFAEFADRVARHRDELRDLLGRLNGEGRLIVGYGASTKGNVILQYCGLGREDVPYIADVNDDKIGSYTPGTLIPIVSEATAREMDPDYLLALPWHFRAGFVAREAEFLAAGGKMIFPLPWPEIVG